MAALTSGAQRTWANRGRTSYGVAASAQIWKGGAVGINAAGFASAYAPGANVKFGGFALEDALGTSTAGAVNVEVASEGLIVLNVSGIGRGDLGGRVYMTNDNDAQKAKPTNGTSIGTVDQYNQDTEVVVYYRAFGAQIAAVD